MACLEEDGFPMVRGVVGREVVDGLIDSLGPIVRDLRGRGGVRNLLALVPAVRDLAESATVRDLVEPVLGSAARAVRGLLFDKTPDANWKVPWHQDLTIAVVRRVAVEGYGPWSVKAGIDHVQPPAEILQGMLAVRIHLDDCGLENGPLRVIPGSHVEGRLSGRQIEKRVAGAEFVSCVCRRGDVVLMRPLLLHASSACGSAEHRRVIHIEYCAGELPGGVSWLG